MLSIDEKTLATLISEIGIPLFFLQLMDYLTEDFIKWERFTKDKRHAVVVPNGIIELMPICGEKYYSFKYVNGHPNNTARNHLTVVAFGVLADVASGYPLMISAMTLLTAIRTAATSALASRGLARKNSHIITMIGCGAQSEFQILAHLALFHLTEVRYFDPDIKAMQRFQHHLSGNNFQLRPMSSIREAVSGSDIIITATAAPGRQNILTWDMLSPGQHISGIGGDSPGKTELDPTILKHSKIVVEYFPQTQHEGEIQNLGDDAKEHVYASLWEIISQKKCGRETEQEITLFDSVGFAIEDYSALRLIYDLAQSHQKGQSIPFIPHDLADCKNLFGLLVKA